MTIMTMTGGLISSRHMGHSNSWHPPAFCTSRAMSKFSTNLAMIIINYESKQPYEHPAGKSGTCLADSPIFATFSVSRQISATNGGEGNLAPFKPLNGLLKSSPLSLVLLHQSRLIAIIISQVS